jgi:hypothetical protein
MAVLAPKRPIQPSQTAERQVDSTNRDVRQSFDGTNANVELVNAHANALTPSVMPIDGFTEDYWACDEVGGSLLLAQAVPGKAGNLTLSAGALPGYVSELGGKCLRLYDDPVLLNVRAQGVVPTPTSATASLSAWFWTGYSVVGGAAQYNCFGHSSLGGANAHFLIRMTQTAGGILIPRGINAAGAGGSCDASGDACIVAGAWHHLGLTYNGALTVLYVDGRGVGSTAAATGSIPWTSGGSSAFLIGTDGTLRGFPGYIRDVMLHSAPRPKEWFEEAYLRGRGRFF